MALHKNLRTALVTLGLFSAAIAGHAQQHPQDIKKLVKAPIAQEAQENANIASLAKDLLANPSDKTNATLLAPHFKMTPTLMSVTMEKAVGMLKLHLQPKEQLTALQSMLASSMGDSAYAQKTFKLLPSGNVVTTAIADVYKSQSLGGDAGWSQFNQAIWKLPKFNVQNTIDSPGVKNLQTLLTSQCAVPKTSLSIAEANTSCAMRSSLATQTVAQGLAHENISDGLLVGEYEGTPVIVMHDGSIAGPAAVYRLEKGTNGEPGSPYIAVSFELLDTMQNDPDTVAFILDHELGHVEHGHTMGDVMEHELEADAVAVRKQTEKGMSAERIAKAYKTMETKLYATLPAQVLQHPAFINMMDARQKNVAEVLSNPQRAGHAHAHSHPGHNS